MIHRQQSELCASGQYQCEYNRQKEVDEQCFVVMPKACLINLSTAQKRRDRDQQMTEDVQRYQQEDVSLRESRFLGRQHHQEERTQKADRTESPTPDPAPPLPQHGHSEEQRDTETARQREFCHQILSTIRLVDQALYSD